MNTKKIKIVEVGPRDGLQNEPVIIDTVEKIKFINELSRTGLSQIEVSSFVSPKAIPQLADSSDVFHGIERFDNRHYSALVPNERGMQHAIKSNVDAVAVFTAASESFCQKNIHCSIDASLERFKPVLSLAKTHHIPVRAYISCVLGCPYEGFIQANVVAEIAHRLFDMGCYEISLGDTIGAGTPTGAKRLLRVASDHIPMENLAIHFHDTRGQALANILACLELGVSTIDSSVAGLGGCPYAEGATGNVATEDVVYMLHGMGYQTGINLDELIYVGQCISTLLNRQNQSRVGNAGVPYDYTNYETTE